jgi:uncharacterized protein
VLYEKRKEEKSEVKKLILIVLFACGISYADDLPRFPFIHVESTADTAVTPDVANLSFRIMEIGEKSEDVKKEVEIKCEKVIEVLERNNVKPEEIRSSELRKYVERERSEGKLGGILGYEISRNFKVRIMNWENYGEILEQLARLDNVVEIHAEFDRINREELESDLFERACQQARKKAEMMARKINALIGRPYAISKEGYSDLLSTFGLRKRDPVYNLSRSGNFGYVPQTISLTSKVNVIFRLK